MRWKQSPQAMLIALLVIHGLPISTATCCSAFRRRSPRIHGDQQRAVWLSGRRAVWVLSFGFMAVFLAAWPTASAARG